MSKTFSLLFYLKKAKIDNTGKAPIYCRITVEGQRSELSIKRNIEPSMWNTEKGYVRGTTEEVRSMNVYIDTVRNKLYEHQREIVDKNIVLTADGLKNMYLGIDECKKTVLEIFEYHNENGKLNRPLPRLKAYGILCILIKSRTACKSLIKFESCPS